MPEPEISAPQIIANWSTEYTSSVAVEHPAPWLMLKIENLSGANIRVKILTPGSDDTGFILTEGQTFYTGPTYDPVSHECTNGLTYTPRCSIQPLSGSSTIRITGDLFAYSKWSPGSRIPQRAFLGDVTSRAAQWRRIKWWQQRRSYVLWSRHGSWRLTHREGIET